MTELTSTSIAPVRPQPPRTIRFAVFAIAAGELINLVAAGVLWLSTSIATTTVIDTNNRLLDSKSKSAHPKADYTAGSSLVSHDIHTLRVSTTLLALLVAAILGLLAYNIWLGRGSYRWLYIAVAIIPVIWFPPLWGIFYLGRGGAVYLAAQLRGFTTIAALVFIILPTSARYFATVKAQRAPVGRGTAGGAARPAGLRGLFAPPPPREARTRPVRPANVRPAGSMADTGALPDLGESTTGRAKPKARTGAPPVPGSESAVFDVTQAESVAAPAPRQRGKSRRT